VSEPIIGATERNNNPTIASQPTKGELGNLWLAALVMSLCYNTWQQFKFGCSLQQRWSTR
jgi:hypothetical protein